MVEHSEAFAQLARGRLADMMNACASVDNEKAFAKHAELGSGIGGVDAFAFNFLEVKDSCYALLRELWKHAKVPFMFALVNPARERLHVYCSSRFEQFLLEREFGELVRLRFVERPFYAEWNVVLYKLERAVHDEVALLIESGAGKLRSMLTRAVKLAIVPAQFDRESEFAKQALSYGTMVLSVEELRTRIGNQNSKIEQTTEPVIEPMIERVIERVIEQPKGEEPKIEQASESEAAPQETVNEAVNYVRMTVVQLKSILKSKGLSLAGKKADLIKRLESSSAQSPKPAQPVPALDAQAICEQMNAHCITADAPFPLDRAVELIQAVMILDTNVVPLEICANAVRVVRIVTANQNFCQAMNKRNILQKFVSLACGTDAVLSYEALWALTNFASTSFTRSVVFAIPELVPLMKRGGDVGAQTVWLFGNISGENAELRDVVLNAKDFLKNFLAAARNSTWYWVANNLSRFKPRPKVKHASVIFSAVLREVFKLSGESLIDACWCIANASEEDVLQSHITEAHMRFLLDRVLDKKLQSPVLRALGNISSGEMQSTRRLCDLGLVEKLKTLLLRVYSTEAYLESKRCIDALPLPIAEEILEHFSPATVPHNLDVLFKEVLWTISNVLANAEQEARLIDAETFRVATLFTQCTALIAKEAFWIGSNTVCYQALRHFVIECGMLDAAFDYIAHGNEVATLSPCMDIVSTLTSSNNNLKVRCMPLRSKFEEYADRITHAERLIRILDAN